MQHHSEQGRRAGAHRRSLPLRIEAPFCFTAKAEARLSAQLRGVDCFRVALMAAGALYLHAPSEELEACSANTNP